MNEQIISEIKTRLQHSEFWTPRTRSNGNTIENLVCPECGDQTAWAYNKKPLAIICNKLKRCGARTKTLALFSISRDVEKRFPATKKEPNKPATAYLHSRGLKNSLKGLKYEYLRDARKTGSGAVMFSIGKNKDGKTVKNGRLFSPPAGEGKTHNIGSTSGMYWKHPAIKYDNRKATYVTEGIFDALSLIELGHQAIAVLSAGQDPARVDLTKHKKLIFAFDNDAAGGRALKKWKSAYPEADAIMLEHGDLNDLLNSAPLETVKNTFSDRQAIYKARAQMALSKSAREYAKIFHETYSRAPGLFKYNKCYFYSWLKRAKDDSQTVMTEKASNFTLEVDHFQLDLANQEEPVYRYRLRVFPCRGQSLEMTVAGTELSAPDALRKLFLTRGRALWKGGAQAAVALAEKIVEAKAPVVRQLHILGYDTCSGCYVFKHFAVDPAGRIIFPNTKSFFKISHRDLIRPALLPSINPDPGGAAPKKVYQLITEAWGDRGATAIAFMVASWFVNQIKPVTGFFPFLSLYGDPQTGKTRLTRFLNAMQGLDEEGLPMSNTNTKKGEIRKLAQVSGLFKALLEGNSREETRFDFASILHLYNINPLQTRANFTNDNRTQELPFLATLVFVQNTEPFRSKAEKERIISVESKTEQITKETREAFDKLTKISAREFARFVFEVLQKRKIFESKWEPIFTAIKGELQEIEDPRIIENHALILTFHRLLCKILKIDYDLSPFILKIAKAKHEACNKRDASLADHFFEQINELEDEESSSFYRLDNEKRLFHLHVAAAEKKLHSKGYKLPLMERLQQSFKEHPAYLESNVRYRFPDDTETDSMGRPKQRRVWVFDTTKM